MRSCVVYISIVSKAGKAVKAPMRKSKSSREDCGTDGTSNIFDSVDLHCFIYVLLRIRKIVLGSLSNKQESERQRDRYETTVLITKYNNFTWKCNMLPISIVV